MEKKGRNMGFKSEKIIRISIVYLISIYQKMISPFLPRACRYEPSCSCYAHQCFIKYPFFKALWLSLKRLGRCHPFFEGGFDPVP